MQRKQQTKCHTGHNHNNWAMCSACATTWTDVCWLWCSSTIYALWELLYGRQGLSIGTKVVACCESLYSRYALLRNFSEYVGNGVKCHSRHLDYRCYGLAWLFAAQQNCCNENDDGGEDETAWHLLPHVSNGARSYHLSTNRGGPFGVATVDAIARDNQVPNECDRGGTGDFKHPPV